jgi:predicted metal-dependent peptidase
MKFTKVIGKADKELIRKAEDKLSAIFTELSLGYDNKSMGTGVGGDPLVFQLVYPIDHICDATAVQLDDIKKLEEELEKRKEAGETIPENEQIPEEVKKFRQQMGKRVLRTAATDGKRYYWNPQFVVDQDRLGLRIVVAHEAWHAIYMHPSRRGSRLPKLWNIAVDYKVNFTIMEDLKAREIRDHADVFTKHLGEFITLEEYAAFLRDPFHPPARLAHFNPTLALKKMADPAYQDPYEDVPPMYYADANLSEDMKRPENVYDYLLAQIPRCPKCGRLGKYKKPEEYKQLQKKIEEDRKKKAKEKKAKEAKEAKAKEKDKKEGLPMAGPDAGCCKDHDHDKDGDHCCDHDHSSTSPGQGQPSASGQPSQQPSDDGACCDGGCCSECGGDDSEYVDPFGAGDTLDDHIDSDVSEEELGKRISDAMEIAKKMAGKVPGALEDELGQLIAPKLTWQDFVRSKILKCRTGFGKNDWTRPKSRPLFAGLYTPKRRDHYVNFLFGYDCSGSMGIEDIAFGVSQVQVIDERGEGFLVPWDSITYWDAMVKIKKATAEELKNAKVKGRGGTHIATLFNEYEDHIGKVDMIIIATDGYLYDNELSDVKVPRGVDVIWLITSHNDAFKPPFGRVFHLRNE